MTYSEYLYKKNRIINIFITGSKFFLSLLLFDLLNSFIKYLFNEFTNYRIEVFCIIILYFVFSIVCLCSYLVNLHGQRNYFLFNKKINDVVNCIRNGNTSNRYGIAVGNVNTILEHPNLSINRKNNRFLGWIESNSITFSYKGGTNKKLKIDPESKRNLWVGTNCIDLDLPLVSGKENDLNIRVLIFDDNKLLKEQLVIPFTDRFVNDNKCIKLKKYLNKKIKEKIKCEKINIGIVSVCENNSSQYELLLLARVDKINKDDAYLYLNNYSKIIDRFILSDDDFEKYALLMFLYLKCDEKFIDELYTRIDKRTKEDIGTDNLYEELELERIRNNKLKTITKKLALRKVYDFFYQDDDSMIYVIFTYIFTEILYPIINELDFFNFESVEQAFLNNLVSFIVPVLHLMLLHVGKRIEKKEDEKHKEYLKEVKKEDFFKGIKVVGDLIKPFKGIRDDELNIIHISNIDNERYISEDLPHDIKVKKNNGEKFRLLEYVVDDINDKTYLKVDSCSYQDVESFKYLEKNINNRNNRKIYSKFKEASDSVCAGNLYTNESRMMIPPNSLCMHMIVVTSDGYILFTKRNKHCGYYSEHYDVSIEEQLSRLDFDKDGARIDIWVRRAIKEELGLDEISSSKDDYMSYKVQAVVREDKFLNFALMVKVELNITKNRLEHILDNWPRQDYEFTYDFCTLDEINNFIVNRKHLKIHPTAFFRFYLLLLEQGNIEMANNIKDIVNSVE